MFTRNLMATLTVLLGFGVAHAADAGAGNGGSEFFHQAAAATSEVTPQLSYVSTTAKLKGGTSITVSGVQQLGANYEYGINEMLAVYGQLGFSSLSQSGGTTNASRSGLNDILLGVKGVSAIGFGSLHYGLGLNYGIEKSKADANGNTTNVSSGGFGLTPYVGWDMAAGPGMWGARLSYQWLGDRTTDNNGTDSKTKGANDLGLATFYEYMLSDMVFGGHLQYDINSDTTTSNPGQADTTATTGNTWTVGAYSRIPLGTGSLLAGLDYAWLAGSKLNSNTDNVDSVTGFLIHVGYRIAF